MSKSGKFYANVSAYVEQTVAAFLEPYEDFRSISFKRRAVQDDSYIRIIDVFGDSYYFDVTAMTEGDICAMICNVVAGEPTFHQINDRDKKREIAPLFDRTDRKAKA